MTEKMYFIQKASSILQVIASTSHSFIGSRSERFLLYIIIEIMTQQFEGTRRSIYESPYALNSFNLLYIIFYFYESTVLITLSSYPL